jgi:hypothetical protein
MRFDRFVDLRQRVTRRVPCPGKLGLGFEDGDVDLGAFAGRDDLGKARR